MIESIGNAANMAQPQVRTMKPERNAKVLETNAPEASEMNPADTKTVQAVQADNSRKFDRLELSDEYLSNMSEKSADSSKSQKAPEKASADEMTADVTSGLSANDSSTDSSSEEVSSNELYKYTDSQLKDLLLDGSISQSEYNSEIAKRES